MTMADMEQTPDFEAPSHESPSDALEAMLWLHAVYQHALEVDMAESDRDEVSVLDRTVRMEQRPYLQWTVASDVDPSLPCDYYQMVFTIPKRMMANGIAQEIVARFPTFTEGEEPIDLPDGVIQWNDVSIEILFAEGQRQRYLLNERGLFAYSDSSDLKLFPRQPNERDLFTGIDQAASQDARRLQDGELSMLLRSCEVKRQSDSPEDV